MTVIHWVLGLFVSCCLAFLIAYFGNNLFKDNVNKGVTFLKVRLWKSRHSLVLFLYILLLCVPLVILYFIKILNIQNILLVCFIWFTISLIVVWKRTQRISTVVSCRLGDPTSEKGSNGLIYVPWGDGQAKEENLFGEPIRRTDFLTKQYYIYFTFKDDVVKYFKNARRVIVIFEIFNFTENASRVSFFLEYDSTDKNRIDEVSRQFKPSEPFSY